MHGEPSIILWYRLALGAAARKDLPSLALFWMRRGRGRRSTWRTRRFDNICQQWAAQEQKSIGPLYRPHKIAFACGRACGL